MRRKALIILLVLAALVYPAAGAINRIAPGDTVFIGEDNLDITAALASHDKLAYFTGGESQPAEIITVTSPMNFYVTPLEFADRTGTWYAWSDTATKASAPLAFYVAEPYLKVKVRDVDLDIDVTNKWIPRGDNAGFSIETNLGTMTERGVAGAPIIIKVKSPSGTTYSSLTNAAGTAQSLDLEVPSSPYDPGISWYTGDSIYTSGTYTVYLESEANDMKDNYNKEGASVSEKVTVLVQTSNPLISSPAATTETTSAATTGTTPATTVVTTTATTVPPATTTIQTTAPPVPLTTIPATTAPVAATTTAPGFGAAASLLAALAAGALLLGRR